MSLRVGQAPVNVGEQVEIGNGNARTGRQFKMSWSETIVRLFISCSCSISTPSHTVRKTRSITVQLKKTSSAQERIN